MKFFGGTVLLILIMLSLFPLTRAQEKLPPEDKAALTDAEKVADQFIERFRQTLDFRPAWVEFRRDDISCAVRGNGVTSESMRNEFRLSDNFLESVYVAIMNYYYLKAAHDLSKAKVDSDVSEESFTHKEIRNYQNKTKYLRENAGEPTSVEEINEMVSELTHLAKLYRKHMPRDAMKNDIWKASVRYFEEYKKGNNRGVTTGWDDMCASSTTKLYTFERSIFYFYFIIERGKLKIAAFGIGD